MVVFHRALLTPLLVALASLSTACTIVPGYQLSPSKGDSGGPPRSIPYDVVRVTPNTITSLREKQRASTQITLPPSFKSVQQVKREGYSYRIGPGDILKIVVWEHPELTNPGNELRSDEATGRLVDAQGKVFFPYVGEFRADGMRLADLRSHISENLQRVIREPQVDANVAAHRSQRVYLTGEVAQPGVIFLNDVPRGLLDAINERGGLTPEASRRRVIISRDGVTSRLDTEALLKYGRAEYNIALEPGDVIHVPDNTSERIFVLGEATSEGPVPLVGNSTTLTEALSSAGGIEQLSAKDAGIFVFRASGKGAEDVSGNTEGERAPSATVYALDTGRMDGFLLADQFQLEPRDVIYVSATGFAKYNRIIRQILPTVSTFFQLERFIDRE
ncbi:polysaccharide biosynthesis/export family protein [Algiphilus sp. NNCM1]|uniref:polysaccharide biosynthesis/export family protein n=1 Tax=Algiphilus sp. TaxID=1872431 RepID=UPI001CA64688|nr:polysaccharide biosynthesis/export family protein [Algiphilus sp.]MBY8965064.1 polysaccharide biosynthesis/export family protein [Algiphilus acroporae]MCI5063463.1 polysaccharide biosynthesis/export family protein [Algiphilus sp.]MCI5104217.1 polysaccharide biosynthesis/export family protein [Algiphilus sp.]